MVNSLTECCPLVQRPKSSQFPEYAEYMAVYSKMEPPRGCCQRTDPMICLPSLHVIQHHTTQNSEEVSGDSPLISREIRDESVQLNKKRYEGAEGLSPFCVRWVSLSSALACVD